MLALIDTSQNIILSSWNEGGYFSLPNGDMTSPAHDGWLSPEVEEQPEILADEENAYRPAVSFRAQGYYKLTTIQEADPIPSDKISTGMEPQLVNNEPKYIHILVDKPAIENEAINDERERRKVIGTTVTITGYGDIPIQGRPEDRENLQGLGQGALARLMLGDTTTLTKFRDAVNTDHFLTPPQMLETWQKGAGYINKLYDWSWSIKALPTIPEDYQDDMYWNDAYWI